MDEKQIDALEAGQGMNTLIADRVMGWKVFEGEPGYGRPPGGKPSLILEELPDYSGTWGGAGMVLEQLHEQGWEIDMVLGQDDPGFDPCECFIMRPDWQLDERIYGHALTLPLTICRAALKVAMLG